MNLIGYWIESLLDSKYFPPQELVGDLPVVTLAKVADYLDTTRGLSKC